MGIFKCSKHGYQSIGLTCVHVADAMETHRPLEVALVLDGWRHPTLLCSSCRIAVAPKLDELEQADASYVEASEAVCCGCVDDWMRAHNLGDHLKLTWHALLRLAGRRIVRLATQAPFDCAQAVIELSWVSHGDEPVTLALSSDRELALSQPDWGRVEVPCAEAKRVLMTIADFVASSPLADERHTDDLSLGYRVLRNGVWFHLAKASFAPAPIVTVWRPPQAAPVDGDAVLMRRPS